MLVRLKTTTYCDENFSLSGLVVELQPTVSEYGVLGSELLKHGAPTEEEEYYSGYDPLWVYNLLPWEYEILGE